MYNVRHDDEITWKHFFSAPATTRGKIRSVCSTTRQQWYFCYVPITNNQWKLEVPDKITDVTMKLTEKYKYNIPINSVKMLERMICMDDLHGQIGCRLSIAACHENESCWLYDTWSHGINFPYVMQQIVVKSSIFVRNFPTFEKKMLCSVINVFCRTS